MSAEPCAWCRELAAEFVLGQLGGQERAVVVRHLESCAPCRREIASLAATVDAVAAVIPPVAPSEGFVDRVVDTLIPAAPSPAPTAPPGDSLPVPFELPLPFELPVPFGRRWRRRRVLAAAVALCLLAAAAVIVATAGWGSGAPGPAAAVAVAMRTGDGDRVGRAIVTNQRPAVITVAFEVVGGGLSPDGRYRVIVLRRGGGTLQLGTVLVTSGRGGLQARASLRATDIAAIEVIGSDGGDLCSGWLPGGPGPPGGPPVKGAGGPPQP